MSSVSVVTNNLSALLRGVNQATADLVGEVTAAVEAEAKINLQEMVYALPEPEGYTRTGFLINSTTSEIDGDEGSVSSAAEYAEVIHEGAMGRSPRPYLTQALETEEPRIEGRARRIASRRNLA